MHNKPNFLIAKLIKWFRQKWLLIPLLDRWIVFELLTPLIFAVAAFTVVSISIGVMFDLVRQIVEVGLPITVALRILIYKLPSFVVISFPMAMLLSTLLAYGRLSENSELKALKSLGVSSLRIIIPALILGIFMTYMTFIFNNNIVPISNRNAEITLSRSLGKAFASEQGEDIIYSRKGVVTDNSSNYRRKGVTHLFYAWKFINGEMIDVTVVDFSKRGLTQLLKAEKGNWNQKKGMWEFFDGTLLTLGEDGTSTRTKFESFMYPLGIDLAKVAELPGDARDMTLKEAIKASRLYKNSGNIKEARRMDVRIQEKYTLPIACVVFALIGSALGSKQNNGSSRSQGFGLSIILILIYYVLSFGFSSLGVKGSLDPIAAAWAPVFISLIGGGYLLKQSSI